MVCQWEVKLKKAVSDVEIEMSIQFDELAADVISHVAFGSDHRAANGVHLAQKELHFLAFSSIFNVLCHIPGFRYIAIEGIAIHARRVLQKKKRFVLECPLSGLAAAAMKAYISSNTKRETNNLSSDPILQEHEYYKQGLEVTFRFQGMSTSP
jgi:hypothetical protein